MMSEYHITEYGRQKILKEVIMRAQKLVGDMLWYVLLLAKFVSTNEVLIGGIQSQLHWVSSTMSITLWADFGQAVRPDPRPSCFLHVPLLP